jgi:Cadherin-like domain/RTX calcium-binding nonapeptide repeat (4 copies)
LLEQELIITKGIEMATVNGTAGKDVLFIDSDKSNDMLLGLAGNDYLDALTGASNNTLNGGEGDDELFAYNNDQLLGEVGNDILTSDGNGTNTLDGGEGNDIIYADRNDVVFGAGGNDVIFGGLGANTITSGLGSDVLWLATVDVPNASNTITDFDPRNDILRLNLAGVNTITDLALAQVGNDATIGFVGKQIALLKNTAVGSINANSLLTDPNAMIPVNLAPTEIVLNNVISTIAENTSTTARIKIADLAITDDTRGTNTLSLGGVDAASFEIDGNALFLKAGTVLDFETKASFGFVINVDDSTVGITPDVTKNFALAVTNINEAPIGSPTTILSDSLQNTPINITNAALLAGFSDVDAGTTLDVANLVATNGTLVKNNNGTFTLTPTLNFSGAINLTYGVTDGSNTLVGQTRSFSVLPPLLAPIRAGAGLLQLSQGGGSTTTLTFSKITHQANNRNELGVFTVDDDNGAVNGFTPGQNGYLAEVLKRSQVIFSALGDSELDVVLDGRSTRTLNLPINSKLGFYLVANGTVDDLDAPSNNPFISRPNVLFSFPTNVNGFQNSQISQTAGIIQIENATAPTPLGIRQQGSKEILDLTETTTVVRTVFEIKRDAGYNNHIGFYKIEDTLGSIKVGTTLLKPGDSGYRQAAYQGRLAGIDLTGTNGQTVNSSGDFQGGALYAPLLIANNSNANSDFSNIYTAYSLGNADLVDHIRLLADNTFGFEDLVGNFSDRDFNDIIVKAVF